MKYIKPKYKIGDVVVINLDGKKLEQKFIKEAIQYAEGWVYYIENFTRLEILTEIELEERILDKLT